MLVCVCWRMHLTMSCMCMLTHASHHVPWLLEYLKPACCRKSYVCMCLCIHVYILTYMLSHRLLQVLQEHPGKLPEVGHNVLCSPYTASQPELTIKKVPKCIWPTVYVYMYTRMCIFVKCTYTYLYIRCASLWNILGCICALLDAFFSTQPSGKKDQGINYAQVSFLQRLPTQFVKVRYVYAYVHVHV